MKKYNLFFGGLIIFLFLINSCDSNPNIYYGFKGDLIHPIEISFTGEKYKLLLDTILDSEIKYVSNEDKYTDHSIKYKFYECFKYSHYIYCFIEGFRLQNHLTEIQTNYNVITCDLIPIVLDTLNNAIRVFPNCQFEYFKDGLFITSNYLYFVFDVEKNLIINSDPIPQYISALGLINKTRPIEIKKIEFINKQIIQVLERKNNLFVTVADMEHKYGFLYKFGIRIPRVNTVGYYKQTGTFQELVINDKFEIISSKYIIGNKSIE